MGEEGQSFNGHICVFSEVEVSYDLNIRGEFPEAVAGAGQGDDAGHGGEEGDDVHQDLVREPEDRAPTLQKGHFNVIKTPFYIKGLLLLKKFSIRYNSRRTLL